MRNRPLTTVYVLAISAALTLFAQQAGTEGATSSSGTLVSHSGLKLPQFFAHDPFILPVPTTHTYYLYTALGARQAPGGRAAVVTYTSSDLKSWAGPRVVFSVPDGIWANPADGAWAPEVHIVKGKYYLCVTLHNNSHIIPDSGPTTHPIYDGKGAVSHLRGTAIFVADSPLGPFKVIEGSADRSATPPELMALDGTLYFEAGQPYMVYAHEWIQTLDGLMEGIPLKLDLSGAAGTPFYLFKGSDAPWLAEQTEVSAKPRTYVTDGPFLYRTRSGKLLMLWSSYRNGLYMETLARSESGKLRGPWHQLPPLVGNDSGHGMLFRTFDDNLMLVLHQPFRQAHAKLFSMKDTGDALAVAGEWK